MTTAERAYLSIIEWPEATDEDWRTVALAAAANLDEHQARLVARLPTPCVAALTTDADRTPILHALRKRHIVAAAPTRAELARAPEPIATKNLAEALGSDGQLFMVEPWRGESQGLRTADIRLLIRASVRASKTSVSSDGTAGRATMYGYMAAGPEGAVVAGALGADDNTAKRSTSTKTSQLLDIYTADKRCFRINADKFAFDCLGDQRTYGDKANLDTLTVKLAELAPKAYIDQGFERFRPPADIAARAGRSGAGATVRSTNAMGAFEFYSPWFAIAYATLLRSAKS